MAGGANPEYGSLENLLLSVGVLMLILVLNRFLKGFARTLSVLIGIAAGTAARTSWAKSAFLLSPKPRSFKFRSHFTSEPLHLKSARS